MKPARRRVARREARLAFDALSVEGGLISTDLLARIARLAADGQEPAAYGVPKGLHLRDEIGRYWRIAQAHWNDVQLGLAGGAAPEALARRFLTHLLGECFGFTSLRAVEPVVLDDRSFPIGHAALDGRVPVVIAPAASGLDTASSAFGDGTRRRSAFGLAQEYLNAANHALWGIATDGVTLRLLRDNASLTRPARIEADLQRIFTEELYADFAALWLLLHESRFGRADQPAADCALESWREAGREEGTRAREHLRRGVEEALGILGQGFLSHPDNRRLRADLQSGALSTHNLLQQLLRLVYRIIFLLTVEERNFLHAADASDAARTLYAEGYSLRRLRERSVRRRARDRFSDLWEATKIVFRGVATGEPRLGLPALAGIFAAHQCPDLDSARLENRALLQAMFRLAWLRVDGALERVNWRDTNAEELGSVYEGLLELVPQITADGRRFGFATGAETRGNARKTTGSYYTPDSLVQVLLDSALEPVVAETIARNPENPIEALLGLSIVDPACGSGHFLLAAARRVADHVARLRANGTPSPSEHRHALREVIGRCIYGVDLNPMAIELCKVSLWLEAVEPGLPLTFLDSHVQQGNALLGTTPELMANGIPDKAWEPIAGDDRKTASALKKRNKEGAEGQRPLSLWTKPGDAEAAVVARAVAELDAAPDRDRDELRRKEVRWASILESPEYRHQKFIADAWCAAFVWPKQPGALNEAAPVNGLWRQIRHAEGRPPALTTETVNELAAQYGFFHWHLQFPQVFGRGGFDVVLGNPPWERVKLQEQEFFASRSEEIANAVNAAARKQRIAALPKAEPGLWAEWCAATRGAEGESHFIRQSGRYPLCGRGDVNTYAIFAEHNRNCLSRVGRSGFIAPTGIATDETTSRFFSDLILRSNLVHFESFENFGVEFAGVNNRQSFGLIIVSSAPVTAATFRFNVNQDHGFRGGEKTYQLSAADIELVNPNTRTCPTFRSRRDADINLAIYRRVGVLWREGEGENGNPWGVGFLRMLDMANDSNLFRTATELLGAGARRRGDRYVDSTTEYVPLVEAKMIGAFNHRFATLVPDGDVTGRTSRKFQGWYSVRVERPSDLVEPQYWVAENEVTDRLRNRWRPQWLLGWRDICRSTDQRTVTFAILPRTAVGHTVPLMLPSAGVSLVASVYSAMCSFVLDYAARQKIGGTHLTYSYLKQLPVPPPQAFRQECPWSRTTTAKDWILPRVLELTYTAWDLQSFANDVGYHGPPFRWDTERRFFLRCELDAAFFHLYGIERDDVDYIMDTFPIVRRNDEKAHGEYRTKRVILEIFDAMAEASRSGRPYETRLDPPPADPRVAHPLPVGKTPDR